MDLEWGSLGGKAERVCGWKRGEGVSEREDQTLAET